MAKKGLSSKLIILKINQTLCNFDVSTDALIFLKDAKVGEDIIISMVEKSSKSLNNVAINTASTDPQNGKMNSVQPASQNNQSVPNNFNARNKNVSIQAQGIIDSLNGSGIYFFDDELKNYVHVDPTVVSGTQSKANAGVYFGVGGAMVSKSFIDGKEANIQITSTRRPVFYFYFDSSSTSLNNSNNKAGQQPNNYLEVIYGYGNQLNSKAFTPNDFKLIKLDIDKNSRYFKGGKMAIGGASSRISSGYFQSFKYERLSSNLFKVYFLEDLDKLGEFCFLYAGNASNNNNGAGFQNLQTEVKVFDFGINWKKKRN